MFKIVDGRQIHTVASQFLSRIPRDNGGVKTTARKKRLRCFIGDNGAQQTIEGTLTGFDRGQQVIFLTPFDADEQTGPIAVPYDTPTEKIR